MRRQRIAMVQTKEQYILCYRAVATLFEQQLKMIDAHTYENLNEDGEPLMNSENEDGEEEKMAEEEPAENKTALQVVSSEPDSLTNSEEESYGPVQPDLIQIRHKKSHFGSLKQSRLHKSTPDFEFDFDGQPMTGDLSETNNSSKHETKLVGKATMIVRSNRPSSRSNRPSIAHLKAMFENMNLPNPDGFVNSYAGRNKGKPSLLKRSMSTREKVGSSNTWSTNHLNMFGQHGSFENLNSFGSKESGWKEKNLYSNDSNESEPDEPIKADPFYGSDAFDKRNQSVDNQYNGNQFNDNRFDQADCNQFSEPIYGFKQPQANEIDKSYIIENVADLPPPPKPPRQFTYQQNEEPFNGQAAVEFKSSADTMLNNRSLNNSHAIDYNLPSYLTNKLSSSKNYYNTIGPIKHRESRPPMPYWANDTSYAKTAYSQSKSTYNIASIQQAKESPAGDLFETAMSRSKSINELSNNNSLYEVPDQRFGVLAGNYPKNSMPITAAPLPNHLMKANPVTNNMHMGNHLANNVNSMPINNYYQHEPQDFYGYVGMNNALVNGNQLNNQVNSHMNNMNSVNHLNNVNKPVLQQPTMNRGGYPVPTLPKPNLQQFSNTLPAHYTTQISLNSQQQQPTYGQQHPPKVQPPMSYVKPMRNTTAIGLQAQNSSGNFRNQQLSVNAANPNNSMTNMNSMNKNITANMNKHVSNGNLQNGLMNGSIMNGSAISGNLNGTISSMCTTPSNVPNGIPNSTSAISLGSKNHYQPNGFSQSSLMHMNNHANPSGSLQQRKETTNGQNLNDKVITVKDDSLSSHKGSACANGHTSKTDKSCKEKQNSHRQNNKHGEKDSSGKPQSNESTSVVKTKKKSSAFTTLSAIFGLKRKKDSKKMNGSTTNLNAISVSNGAATNGKQLVSFENDSPVH